MIRLKHIRYIITRVLLWYLRCRGAQVDSETTFHFGCAVKRRVTGRPRTATESHSYVKRHWLLRICRGAAAAIAWGVAALVALVRSKT